MIFTRANFSDPDFKKLIVQLDKDLLGRYPLIQHKFAPFNFMDEHARIVLVHDGEAPIACGAFRPKSNETVEIKRMFTHPDYRKRGIGKQVLNKLELWAKEEGFVVSILETGNNQPEAIAAYQKSEYIQIPNFAPYENVKESLCFSKKL